MPDPVPSGLWHLIGLAIHYASAVAAASVAGWLIPRRDRFGPIGGAICLGLLLTASWSVAVAAAGDRSLAATLAEAVRNLAWLFVLYRLFGSDGRLRSLAPIRPVALALAFVELVHLAVAVVAGGMVLPVEAAGVLFGFGVIFRLLVTVGALVLVHNLYVGASRQSQAALRWPASGLAVVWAFDLNLYTVAYLSGDWPVEIAALRGLAVMALAALLAMGGARNRDVLRFRPSRSVAFQTVSLLIIGIYLVAMVAVAQWLSYAGGDFSRLMGLGFLTVASVGAILFLPSARLRGWLRVTLTKHLFQHRYDYREEWLRFARTIGNNRREALPLGERVVQAVADIAECPGGLLLTPGEHGELALAARWQWPDIEVPAAALPARAVQFFESKGYIADLDDARTGRDSHGAAAHLPDWLLGDPRAWAVVPLIHFEQLVGAVVLSRPPVARAFDWEDFDLLRIVGQQLASYLAEGASQEALAEAGRFEDFNRRIAFVMHDIKNLASQFALLARNAERHADNPEFRKDMLVTLRNSSDKLNALLARLSRYGGAPVDRMEEIDAAEVARAAVERFRGGHMVTLVQADRCMVRASREPLEQVLVHLVQNGIDASAPGSPVFVSVTGDGLQASIEVVDSGAGMSPEFVRTKLFRPFVSSKPGGFGIGAFEARELVRAMRGRLEVESREGLGSRFVVRLPLAAASSLFDAFSGTGRRAGDGSQTTDLPLKGEHRAA